MGLNAAELHLALNHVPVLGTIFAFLLLAWGHRKESDEIVRTAVGVLFLVAVAGGLVYLTGEPAEEVVEGMSGIPEAAVEAHEELAVVAAVVLGIVGLWCLWGLFRFRRPERIPRWYSLGTLLITLAPMALLLLTAYRGGRINHPELRDGEAVVEEGREEALLRRPGDTRFPHILAGDLPDSPEPDFSPM